MKKMEYHRPVLLKESVEGLNIDPSGTYVDVTFGGGGHSAEILKHLNEKGKLYAFDQDEDAQQNSIDDPRFRLIPENFRYIKRFLRFEGVRQVDGILGDFGVSSHQFNEESRGFSIRFDAELDMRMSQKGEKSAFQVINNYNVKRLKQVFKEYGELRGAFKLANSIVEARIKEPITTGKQLKKVLSPFLPTGRENKLLARVYQAIRIEVNQEIVVLEEFLQQTESLLKPGGRLSLISYHSLEDRLVKRFIRSGMFEGEPEKDFYGNIQVPFKKVGGLIHPSPKEIESNNRARSAKLRIAEKC